MKVVKGRPCVHGADLSEGWASRICAPMYTLPLGIECSTEFSLVFEAVSPEVLCPDEVPFYFPATVPDGFNEILPGVFHSPIIRGPTYPAADTRFIDSVISRNSEAIFFVGGSNRVGKSTFCRYMMNRILSHRSRVALLDLDIGQPHFALCGTISLTLLSDFVFQPPEHTSDIAQKVVFYGASSPSHNVERYLSHVNSVLNRVPKDVFVVVNSFGWVEDLGLRIHHNLMEMINPTTTFLLTKSNETPAPINTRTFKIEINLRTGVLPLNARCHRNLRIWGYFRRGLQNIASQQPISVLLSDVRIGVACVEVPGTEILTAICGSMVALCWDKRIFAPSDVPVSILANVPPLKVNGFGIVRAIDKEKGVIYILSPCEGVKFNTLVLGSISVPASVYNDTCRCDATYLGIGLLNKLGASTDPLVLKNPPVHEA
jgi:polynucleotide 5'-hydroxyl-kinase GRC3/NOL9